METLLRGVRKQSMVGGTAFVAGPFYSRKYAELVSQQTASPLTWADVENFRKIWPRNLVIKGIMHPDDAIRSSRHRGNPGDGDR